MKNSADSKTASNDYTTGRQPCQEYTPKMEANEHAMWQNVHECYRCRGTVSFCLKCCKDHHGGGIGGSGPCGRW